MTKKILSQITQPLLAWYDTYARILPWREFPSPYRIWVSEIMLQQTRVETVIPYFERFISVLPDFNALANADEQSLLKLWEGLGYYSRVKNMQKAAKIIMFDHGGIFPSTYEELIKLPGIGTYSAGAIASIAFNGRTAAVDGNVLRVITRVTASEENISNENVKRDVKEQILKILPDKRVGDFNQALMELGAVICLPSGMPKCGICPLNHLCLAYKNDLVYLLPVKSAKKERKIENKTVFLFICCNKIAIRKRNGKGVLAGLWEFPNTDGTLSTQETKEWLEKNEISFDGIEHVGNAKHIFTHIEWNMTIYCILLNKAIFGKAFVWVTREKLEHDYPIPSAFQFCMKQIKKIL